MDKHRLKKKLIHLLDQIIAGQQLNNSLRHQLLAEIQIYLENIDRTNNNLIHQEKFVRKEAENEKVFQKRQNEIRAYIEEVNRQQVIENDLLEELLRSYEILKKILEKNLNLSVTINAAVLLEVLDNQKKAHEKFMQMLFDTIKECKHDTGMLTKKIEEINSKISRSEDRVKELKARAIIIQAEIDKWDKRIVEFDKRIAEVNKQIVEIDKRIDAFDIIIKEKEKHIAHLVEKAKKVDVGLEELYQARRQIIEDALPHINKVSKLVLTLVQSDDKHLTSLIKQDLAVIELNHAYIISELKDTLFKKEVIDHAVIDQEINNIVKNLLVKHHHGSLSEADINYLIKGISINPYYKNEVEKLTKEIVQEYQTLTQSLNASIKQEVAQRVELVRELGQATVEKESVEADKEKSVIEKEERVSEKNGIQTEKE